MLLGSGGLSLDVKVRGGLSLFCFSFRSFFSLLTLALKGYAIGQWGVYPWM